MDTANLLIIGVLFILLALSAFFSAAETAFSSFNRIKMKSMAAAGNKNAALALTLTEDYNRLLSTVLIGNNIMNIVTSSLATVLFVGYFGNMGVSIATLVTTVLVLMLGEITPKSLAKEAPEAIAAALSPILRVLVAIFTPVNYLLDRWKDLIVKLFHISSDRSISEEELLSFVSEVREEGGINRREEEMIRTVIEFDELEAKDIVTPRIDLSAVDIEESFENIGKMFRETGYSRLPVYQDTTDSIKGVILEKDFNNLVKQQGKSIEKIIRPAVFATKNVKISKLLNELRTKKTHMAVIIDEYGGTIGIVTLEDIIEELVGEIWDEHDEIVEEIQKQADGSYEVLGGADTEELAEFLGIEIQTGTATVGGWIMEVLHTIPNAGDCFDYEGYQFIVAETLRNRIIKVNIKQAQEQDSKTQEQNAQD